MKSLLQWRDLMCNLSVIACDSGKITLNGEKHKAERFTLHTLSDDQRRWLNGFSNIKISKCTYRRAPEITHPVVYLIY